MAIVKRNGKKGVSYQVKVIGSDGRPITQTFERKSDAEEHESKLLYQKRSGLVVRNVGNQITVSEYLPQWNDETLNGRIGLRPEPWTKIS